MSNVSNILTFVYQSFAWCWMVMVLMTMVMMTMMVTMMKTLVVDENADAVRTM